MLSRVAESIYWMSRYVERAENLARFVDVTHHMSLDLPPGSQQQWEASCGRRAIMNTSPKNTSTRRART